MAIANDIDGALHWSTAGIDVELTAPGATPGVDGSVLRLSVELPPRSTVTRSWSLSVRDDTPVVAPAPARRITLRPPMPGPVGALQVTCLRVGEGRLDVSIDRAGTETVVSAPAGFRVDVG